MSLVNLISVTCPKCKSKFQTEIWNSINVSLDPDAKKSILNGNFFKAICQNCTTESILQYPCLYHDMDKKLMIWIIPSENELKKYTDLNDPIKENYNLRIVQTHDRLIEKIYIFDNDLDDKVIEIYKIVILEKIIKEKPEFKPERAYCIFANNENSIIFYNNEGKSLISNISKNYYDEIKSRIEKYEENKKGFLIVDTVWAMKFFKIDF